MQKVHEQSRQKDIKFFRLDIRNSYFLLSSEETFFESWYTNNVIGFALCFVDASRYFIRRSKSIRYRTIFNYPKHVLTGRVSTTKQRSYYMYLKYISLLI